jgi:hypothetical protein
MTPAIETHDLVKRYGQLTASEAWKRGELGFA